jgi:hypothetical protein
MGSVSCEPVQVLHAPVTFQISDITSFDCFSELGCLFISHTFCNFLLLLLLLILKSFFLLRWLILNSNNEETFLFSLSLLFADLAVFWVLFQTFAIIWLELKGFYPIFKSFIASISRSSSFTTNFEFYDFWILYECMKKLKKNKRKKMKKWKRKKSVVILVPRHIIRPPAN